MAGVDAWFDLSKEGPQFGKTNHLVMINIKGSKEANAKQEAPHFNSFQIKGSVCQETQLQAYVRWMNCQLRKRPGYRRVGDLRSDLRDGVILAQLVESLGGECVTGIDLAPATPAACKENVERTLQFLAAKNVRVPITGSRDVVEGDLKSIMRLIHALAAHYKAHTIQKNGLSTRSSTMSLYQKNDNTKQSPPAIRPAVSSLSLQRQTVERRKVIGAPPARKRCEASPVRPVKSTVCKQGESPRQVGRGTTPLFSEYNSRATCLRKAFSVLDAERLARGGGEVDGASSTSSSTSEMQMSVHRGRRNQCSVRRAGCPRTGRNSLVTRSEPASLNVPHDVAKSSAAHEAENDIPVFDSNDAIYQLAEDIRTAKEQLLLLQDVLLHGHWNRSGKSEKTTFSGDTAFLQEENIPEVVHLKQQTFQKMGKCLRIEELVDVQNSGSRREAEGKEDVAIHNKHENQDLDLTRKTLGAENERLAKQLEERNLEINQLKEELQKCLDEMNIQKAQYEETLRSLSSANQAKASLTSQLTEQDKKIVKLEHSLTLPLSSRLQREELQVVREALMSLRHCFGCNDPYQHTLDTVEQSISALLERVNALENSKDYSSMNDTTCSVETTVKVRPELADSSRMIQTIPGHPESWSEGIHKNGNGQITKVLYFTDKSVTPFLCVIPKRLGEITLKDFKMMYDRPGHHRYHFKTLDPEFGMVKEEILHDDNILPGWDEKIIAWIEDEGS